MWRSHIMGGEKEYGILPNDFLSLGDFEGYRLLFGVPKILYRTSATRVWLANGGSLYQDTEYHPEYASPEFSNARDAVIWMKAGDRIFEDIVESIHKNLFDQGGTLNREVFHDTEKGKIVYQFLLKHIEELKLRPPKEFFRIYRHAMDTKDRLEEKYTSANVMFGEHENHIISKECNREILHDVLLAHYVSRIIWQGAGSIYYEPSSKKYIYRLSQRETQTGDLVASSTTSSKPIINTRDEALADPQKWFRLHIVGGDANMSEVATRLKWGTTALLIQLWEEGYFSWGMFRTDRRDLRGCYHFFARDITYRKTVDIFGNHYSALNIQQMLLDKVADFFDRGYGERTEEVNWQLIWWQKMLDLAAQENPLHALAPYTDVGQKYFLISSDMDRHRYSWNTVPNTEIFFGEKHIPMTAGGRLKWWDLEYHRISRKYGIFQKLPMKRVCTDEEIQYATFNPPLDTRAAARCKTAQHISSDPDSIITAVDWQFIQEKKDISGIVSTYLLPDPFQSKPDYKKNTVS